MTLAARLDDLEVTLEHMLMDVFVSTQIRHSFFKSLFTLSLRLFMFTLEITRVCMSVCKGEGGPSPV